MVSLHFYPNVDSVLQSNQFSPSSQHNKIQQPKSGSFPTLFLTRQQLMLPQPVAYSLLPLPWCSHSHLNGYEKMEIKIS